MNSWNNPESRPVYDSNFQVSRLGLKNLEFEETLRQKQTAPPERKTLNSQFSEFNRQTDDQEKLRLTRLLQEKNGDFFEEHFEESEESRINFNENDNDVNIVIRQSNRPVLMQTKPDNRQTIPV